MPLRIFFINLGTLLITIGIAGLHWRLALIGVLLMANGLLEHGDHS